ncbi:hypothetical protein HPB50_025271 [Hyalomma asiaticum]|uniref:Uncharacterized protein n=1 Tax=Hyalomma asiaticum TaxID=266040 RepID=A0ACB7RWB1_HYAAI|nr:hypothetical protein HPB50_025271 [Hyalomma asiaticum]
MEVGSPRLTGLGDIWAYKQYSSACFSGTTTYVEVTAFARVPLAVTMSWKGCTGGSGHMGIRVSSSQLRLVFKAAPTNDDPAHLELARIYPVSLEEGEVFVSGAPKLVTRLAHYASMFMKHQIQHLWSYILRMEPQILLRDMRPHA